ncbi:MAG: class I tRNA ligase family protein [Candidatus Saccharibacteria bacterium]|nr:class I tRNA ligase family protein [Candidatus Saccharibacteria bacterium]
MQRYEPLAIEKKWQKKWDDDGTYVVDFNDHSKPKYYGMSMLPGITGAGIHIGHGRTFQFSDIKVRAKRQQGFNAYNPIGWDSFGLPVENYAIKVGKKPRIAHDEAKENFKTQLKRLGYSYDWTKEISTADPEYYKWTQWIFNKLYEHGLAYQKESSQWWCETDQTVLANEQVEGGKCWRCGNPVTKKNLKQWFFKITEYADEILEATDDLNWTEMVKTMQKNWIGKSQGAEVDFQIVDSSETVKVFTTRADTLFGSTFLVLAPENELVNKITTAENKSNVDEYIKTTLAKSEIERQENKEKTGVFSGSYAINPVNGENIPVWIADYVLTGYGTGAIMAVPAHDERDNAFAQKFDIPIRYVIEPTAGTAQGDDTHKKSVFIALRNPKTNKVIVLDWGPRQARTGGQMLIGGGVEGDEDFVATATREITEETGYKNFELVKESEFLGHGYFYSNTKNKNMHVSGKGLLFDLVDEEKTDTNLDDGEQGKFTVTWQPISAIANMLDDGIHEAMYRHLVLKECYNGEGVLVNSGQFDGMTTEQAREEIVGWLEQQKLGNTKVQYKMRDWLISRQRYWGAPIPIVYCEADGTVPIPDTDLPVILPDVDDYKPTGGNTSVLAGVEEWVNTTCPKCGGPAKRETDTMDGYACSSWYFLRYLDPFNENEAWNPEQIKHWAPVDFYNGADHAVAHLLYARFWMRFFYKLRLVGDPEPFKRMMYNSYIMAPDGRKMSKSLGNVIDPMEIMDSGYGADSLRVYEMFIAPYDMDAPWDPRGVPGTYRFLNRTWNLVQEYLNNEPAVLDDKQSAEILKVAHKTSKKVTDDIENDKFNTAVSAMMEAVNNYFKLKESAGIGKNDTWLLAIESLLQVLAPFAPHITEELWSQLGRDKTIHIDNWPQWDEQYLVSDIVTIPVQINGKVRATLTVTVDISESDVIEQAKSHEKVVPYLEGKELKKAIYVSGRIVNLVVV